MKKISLIFLILLCLSTILFPEAPKQISFQGKLTQPSGNFVRGNTKITFKLYDSASGGTALWTEIHDPAYVNNGIFNVELGSIVPITLSFDRPYWLSLTIESDNEMSPRRKLKTSPYAFRSILADTATFADTAFMIADGAI